MENPITRGDFGVKNVYPRRRARQSCRLQPPISRKEIREGGSDFERVNIGAAATDSMEHLFDFAQKSDKVL